MKVAFLCPAVSRTAFGIFETEMRLAQALHGQSDCTVEVYGTEDEYSAQDQGLWHPLLPRTHRYHGASYFRYSPGLERDYLGNDADIGHLQVLWMHQSIVMNRWASRTDRPYVTSLHGMLDPWAVRNSGWKKRLALALYERKCLTGAACLHATSMAEAEAVRAFGLDTPICVIPNGIDPAPEPPDTPVDPPWERHLPPGKRVLLYLGRLHAKKGLDDLLEAWAQAGNAIDDWHLVIVGGGGGDPYEEKLRADIRQRELQTSVTILGKAYGSLRDAAFRRASAFVLPSHSEGLPMAVLSAWSYGLPVLMTHQCNLPEGGAAGAAILTEDSAVSLGDGLARLLSRDANSLKEMGENGRKLVNERFRWESVARSMRSVYDWALGLAARPDCVWND